ncbi:MAG TPA: hypothetical protein VK658_19770 [Chryseolinea sp.]|nr:hypothetical protein [Chryseolinea sp.]
MKHDMNIERREIYRAIAACCEGLSANETFVLARFGKDLQSLG